ncbi:DoxX family protein [Candidatus Nitronereus thalassa]|uniref:DoxX family protein n=1 Tax=Candidatus Nitronereus thalassa TaxID=3020898 RepID=A0ABU3K6Z4_9BACT|nr:DoxX family protein [Candidatus Nitronereus thalassa]MDT7042209.1 DoxX family protein [Candidatus Nitronereus thalassa]
MKQFFQTDDRWSGFIIRVMLALVIFPHGAQKLLGWFGGNGFEGTMGFFTQQAGLPWLIAFLVIIGESIGALALAAGFFTRFSAASLGVIMLGAIAMVHWPHGFFMNWFGQQAGEGFEFHLLVIGMALALVANGGGKWSVDGVIAQKLSESSTEKDVVNRKLATSAA